MTRIEQGGVNVCQTCSEWEKLKFMNCLFVETLIQGVRTVDDCRQPEIQKWRARMRETPEEGAGHSWKVFTNTSKGQLHIIHDCRVYPGSVVSGYMT